MLMKYYLAFCALFKYCGSFIFYPVLPNLYQLYLRQGIPFRENTLLGNKPILRTYDFVVIGAGPGGSAVAGRLSEIPTWKILLLEAGQDETIYTDIPATCAHWQLTDYNWGYKAEKTEGACLGTTEQRCPWPRGKGMGGTSILNYMIYTRGHKKDYDDYSANGNAGWSYDEILPYFLKSENNSILEYQTSKYHSQQGPLNVQRVPYRSPLIDAFLEGGKELGYPTIDYTEPTQYGFSRIQATTNRGWRVSASKAYLKPVRYRANLHVAIFSRVTKILIDPVTKRAYGVEYFKKGRRRVVLARKEVILSAGSLNSPQLLMLSGVGPKEHLEELGIPVIQDLRVGENLQEHYTTTGLVFSVNQTGIGLVENRLNVKVFMDWLNKGRGLLTVPGGVEGIGYMSTKYNTEQIANYSDMEFVFASGSIVSDAGKTVRRTFDISDRLYNEMFKHLNNRDTWTIFPMLLHPKSKGVVLLRDKDPWHAPKFIFNYFRDESDLRVMVEGVKEVVRLSETYAFKKLGTELNPVPVPDCAQHAFKSDEYWACFVRVLTGTLHHQCGTCKMGPSSDPSAVVNERLKVHGIEGLRVVDASIFPTIPGAHLYAPTLMVGEKASDMIKQDWLTKQDTNGES